MKTGYRLALGLIGLSTLAGQAGPAVVAGAAPARAACAATGSYTVLRFGANYAASGVGSGAIPLYGGKATIPRYTGCGSPTQLRISSDGPGTLLSRPVAPVDGYRLRAAGDLLLHFVGTARQDSSAPKDVQAVRLSGTATYARVTTTGVLRGKRQLAYSTKTVTVTNVVAHLKVTTDLGGAFSLACALPGPKIGQLQSNFNYVAVGVRNAARVTATTPPSKNL